jgi:rhomboid protease GluP
MTINDLLLWVVSFSSLAFIFRLIRGGQPQNRSWILISGGVLVVSLLSWILKPQLAGWISITCWILLVVLPLLGFNRVNQLIYQQDYQQAYQLSKLLRWLHPVDGWQEQPRILYALVLGQRGDLLKASQILNAYRDRATPLSRHATVILYWMGANWDECRRWFEQVPKQVIKQELNLIPYYLRSLGETGDVNGLVQEGFALKKVLKRANQTLALDLVDLFIFVFCGQTPQVQRLLDPTSSLYSPEIAQFWKLTLLMVKGQPLVHQQLLTLQRKAGSVLKNAIDWRLAHPPRQPDILLTPASEQLLAVIRLEFAQRFRRRATFQVNRVQAYGTYGLVALNVGVFVVEVALGGSTNSETLTFLGALLIDQVWTGEWWRIVTANFLHFGVGHLVMNMLGLWVIGPLVEHALGIGGFFLCYGVSGIGTMFLIAYLQLLPPSALLVGASAAIMGLVGAIAAVFLKTWQQEKTAFSAKRLRFILFLIGLQFLLDWIIPEVSFLAHALGVFLGFVTARVFLRLRDWRTQF